MGVHCIFHMKVFSYVHLSVAAEEAAGMVVAGYFVEICIGCLHVELVNGLHTNPA